MLTPSTRQRNRLLGLIGVDRAAPAPGRLRLPESRDADPPAQRRRARDDGADSPPGPVSGPIEVRALAEDVNAPRPPSAELRAPPGGRLREPPAPLRGNPSPMSSSTPRRPLPRSQRCRARRYGYSRDEFIGMSIEDLRSAGRAAARLDPGGSAASDGLSNGDLAASARDGPSSTSRSADHRFEGVRLGWSSSLDVTERIEAERAPATAKPVTATCSRTRAT